METTSQGQNRQALEIKTFLKYNQINDPCDGGTILTHMLEDPATTLDTIQYLIAKDANVNAKNSTGESALMIACRYSENLDIIKYLLDNGAMVNAKNNTGETALMIACQYNENLDIVKLLIESGASMNEKGSIFQTPYIYAQKNPNEEVFKYLDSL